MAGHCINVKVFSVYSILSIKEPEYEPSMRMKWLPSSGDVWSAWSPDGEKIVKIAQVLTLSTVF